MGTTQIIRDLGGAFGIIEFVGDECGQAVDGAVARFRRQRCLCQRRQRDQCGAQRCSNTVQHLVSLCVPKLIKSRAATGRFK